MRAAVFQNPHLIASVLIKRIEEEKNATVLSRLLWAANLLAVPTYSSMVIQALQSGRASNWDNYLICGSSLVLLARLTSHDPIGVLNLLPKKLNNLNPAEAMYYQEILVYAWWAVASQSSNLPADRQNEPWEQLKKFAQMPPLPDLSNWKNKEESEPHEVYEWDAWVLERRGSLLAQIALTGRDTIKASEFQTYETGTWWPRYSVDISQIVEKHSKALISNSEVHKIQSSVLSCLHSHLFGTLHHPVDETPPQKAISDATFYSMGDCVDALSTLLENEPISLIRESLLQLPRSFGLDFCRFKLTRRLLELGRRDVDFLLLCEEICCGDKEDQAYTFSAKAEHDSCLSLLAAIYDDGGAEFLSEAVSKKWKKTQRDIFSSTVQVEKLVQLTDDRPEQILKILDDMLEQQEDLLMLYQWKTHTKDWRCLLIAKVFHRMFSSRPISPAEAQRLCIWILTALQALPESPLRRQWWMVYTNIYSELKVRCYEGEVIKEQTTPIRSRHFQAIRLLNESKDEAIDSSWFKYRLEAEQTLYRATSFDIKDGSLSFPMGGGGKTLFNFPAVRLVAIALDGGKVLVDPLAKRMQHKEKLDEFCKKYEYLLNPRTRHTVRENERLKAIEQIELLSSEESNDNCLLDHEVRIIHVTILLLCGQPLKAKEASLKYLADLGDTDYVSNENLFLYWYNLACAHSILEEIELCQEALEKAASFQPLDSEDMAGDTDFNNVRETEWFKELLVKYKREKKKRTVRHHFFPPAFYSKVEKEGNEATATIDFSSAGIRAVELED